MAFDTGWTVSNESGLDPLGGWPICRSGRQCVGGLWAEGEGGCVHRCLDCALTTPIYATCTNRWGTTCALSTSRTGTRYIYGHVHTEWMQFVQLTYTFNTSENVRVARNWHGKSSETTVAKDLTDGICQFIRHFDPDQGHHHWWEVTKIGTLDNWQIPSVRSLASVVSEDLPLLIPVMSHPPLA